MENKYLKEINMNVMINLTTIIYEWFRKYQEITVKFIRINITDTHTNYLFWTYSVLPPLLSLRFSSHRLFTTHFLWRFENLPYMHVEFFWNFTKPISIFHLKTILWGLIMSKAWVISAYELFIPLVSFSILKIDLYCEI